MCIYCAYASHRSLCRERHNWLVILVKLFNDLIMNYIREYIEFPYLE